MKDNQRSAFKNLKKSLGQDDKLEQLVLDFAIRKTTGSREDLNGVFYSKNGRHVIMASKSLSGKYDVCEGTREIDADAFWGCAYLTEISLPEGIESIGHEAFGRCISLKKITIPRSMVRLGSNPFIGNTELEVSSLSPNVTTDGKAVFTNGGKTLVSFISKVAEYTVPEGVETIAEKAFSKNKFIKNIQLPDSLRIIDDEAFFDCDALAAVKIPAGVTNIGVCAFADCEALRSVEMCGIPEVIKRSMLSGCDDIRTISIPSHSTKHFSKLAADYEDRIVERTDNSTAKPTDKETAPKTAKEKTKHTDKKNAKHSDKENTESKDKQTTNKKRKSPMYK